MYIKYIEQFVVLELMQFESLSQRKRKDEKKNYVWIYVNKIIILKIKRK